MRLGIDENYPKDGVDVQEVNGVLAVRLFKDVQRTPGPEEGQEIITANVVQITLPLGIEKADVLAHFDYYFAKGEAEELARALPLKEDRVERLLSATDYKALKVADGAMTSKEYEPWKKLRAHWRDTINKMQACKTIEELDAIKYAETPEGLDDLEAAGAA